MSNTNGLNLDIEKQPIAFLGSIDEDIDAQILQMIMYFAANPSITD